MPIQEIQVKGYRSVRDVRLKLQRINVLTGPNASGKSNLYNSIFLMAKVAEGGFARLIAEEGGMPSVLWAGPRRNLSSNASHRDPMRFSLRVKTDTFSYELVCGLPRLSGPVIDQSAFILDPEVKEEKVWMDDGKRGEITFLHRSLAGAWVRGNDGKRVSYSGQLNPSESVFSQLREPHLYPELACLRSEMSQWRFYHHFRTDSSSPLRHPQIGVRTLVLGHDGSDLAAALQTIEEIGFGEEMQESIAQAFPGASLIIEYTKGLFGLSLKMPGLTRTLQARELSDGTLRYLCLLAALMSPRPPSLLALNEPETSLHPDLLEPLAKLIVRASRNCQLWVVTHSQRLAQFVEMHSGAKPIQLELTGGETRIAGQRLIDNHEDE